MMFQWNRVMALKRYSSGDIIVAAETIEEARAKARAAAGAIYGKYRGMDECPLAIIDEDDVAEWHRFREQLDRDLDASPNLVESSVVMIWGSE